MHSATEATGSGKRATVVGQKCVWENGKPSVDVQLEVWLEG